MTISTDYLRLLRIKVIVLKALLSGPKSVLMGRGMKMRKTFLGSESLLIQQMLNWLLIVLRGDLIGEEC